MDYHIRNSLLMDFTVKIIDNNICIKNQWLKDFFISKIIDNVILNSQLLATKSKFNSKNNWRCIFEVKFIKDAFL